MPNNESDNKLKLVHLVWMVLATVAAASVTWGITINQQKTNTANIEKKVDKEIMNMHMEQQKEQFLSMDKKLDQILAK